jgi:hypothetical protein
MKIRRVSQTFGLIEFKRLPSSASASKPERKRILVSQGRTIKHGLTAAFPVLERCLNCGKIPAQNKKAHIAVSLMFIAVFVVGRAGFEPATNGLKVRCSTS